MTKDFNYHLTGTGWSEAFFTSDTQNVRFEISYLSNPLSDLFEGLCRLLNNQSDTEKVIFAEEPGEHSLFISKQDNDLIKVEIFWSDEWEEISIAYKTTSKKRTCLFRHGHTSKLHISDLYWHRQFIRTVDADRV